MLLPIVKYGNPVLRQKGARIETLTPTIRRLISDMLETMYENKGVGLAAQQVGLPIQLTVVDVRGVTDRPSTLEVNGVPTPLEDFMPLVLMNPEITPVTGNVTGPEGCLSFPEMYGDVSRPDVVDVKTLDKDFKPIAFRCGGLLSRAIQHETDHLHGILFIDRMDKHSLDELRPELEVLQAATRAAMKRG